MHMLLVALYILVLVASLKSDPLKISVGIYRIVKLQQRLEHFLLIYMLKCKKSGTSLQC